MLAGAIPVRADVDTVYPYSMLVDVVQLNFRGVRRPRDEWRTDAPVRGELKMLKYFSWHGHENAPVFAALTPYLLDPLDHAKVVHMAGQNIVIKGSQKLPEGTWEQVWWCRIVSEGQHDAAIWNDLLRRLSLQDSVESSLPL